MVPRESANIEIYVGKPGVPPITMGQKWQTEEIHELCANPALFPNISSQVNDQLAFEIGGQQINIMG